jgi:hypothetical protein
MDDLRDDVRRPVQVRNILHLQVGESTQKIGGRRKIGTFRGKVLEVDLDDERPSKN